MGEDEDGSDNLANAISVLRSQEKRDLTDVKKQRVSEGIRESQFHGLVLAEYVMAKKYNCHLYHKNGRRGCEEMVNAGEIVPEEKCVVLPTLWRRAFHHVKYDCEKAQRRLLRMPVACLRLKEGCFVVEKTSTGLYEDKMSEISTRVNFPKLHGDKDVQMENVIDEFTNFLNAAPNSGERERMKHLMASSYNMSARRAHTFGMSNLRKRAEKVVSAAEKIRAIKNKHLHFAKIEQKVYLQSIGRPHGYLSSSSSSESEHSEDEEDKDMIPDEINNERPLDIPH